MKLDITETDGRLWLAIEAGREAGNITLEYFRREDLKVERKGDDTPVTVADRHAEEHLRRRIAEAFPDDAIHGEEMPDRAGETGFRWVLDPIDGTKSFIHGVPLYGTLVGVEFDAEPILGMVYIPGTDEYVYAARGQGAWYVSDEQPPRPARVSQCESLCEGLFLTSEVATFDEIKRREAYYELQDIAKLSRSWGDCYGYMMVATGRAEVIVDPVVAVWDLAALPPIIEEAGGTFTDWQGRRTIYSGQAVATNGKVHQEVLDVLGGSGE